MVAATRSRAAYSLTDVTPARTIWVYRNGDSFFLGRKFVINHRYVPTFEAFMIQLNEGVPTAFGVRKVYTPQEGHPVNDLTAFRSGGKYVAAGRERFRKLNYLEIRAKKPQGKKKYEEIRPVVHSNIKVPSKWQSVYNKPQIINVFKNGDMLVAPVKIVISKFTLKKWDCVLELINEKVLARWGAIHRLYTLCGQVVHGPEELEDNQFYVACSKEKFQSLPYLQHPKVAEHIRRDFANCSPERPKSPKRKEPNMPTSHRKAPTRVHPVQEPNTPTSHPKAPTRVHPVQEPNTPTSHRKAPTRVHPVQEPNTPTSHPKAPTRVHPVQLPTEQPKKGEGDKNSVFYAKSKKASPEKAPKELSSDDGHSVFKAVKPQEETEGAQEIQEDQNVQVDMPVDQASAETVLEEVLYASPKNVEEKMKEEDGHYEEQNLEPRQSVFKRMFSFLSRPSKTKGMREEKKEQDATKCRKHLFIKEREFFDENDCY